MRLYYLKPEPTQPPQAAYFHATYLNDMNVFAANRICENMHTELIEHYRRLSYCIIYICRAIHVNLTGSDIFPLCVECAAYGGLTRH